MTNVEEYMKAKRPEECDELMEKAIQTKDLDLALSLYEEGAAFITPGGVVTDHAELRKVLEGMMELEEMRFTERVTAYATANHDLALTLGRWEAVARDSSGKPVKVGGRDVEVVRRQADGTWKFVVDHPNVGD